MKISPGFADSVIEDFFGWVSQADMTAPRLQHYIVRWLMRDDGVLITGGEWGNWLLAVFIIQHAYVQEPSRLDYHGEDGAYRERRANPTIDLDDDSARYFDRQMYQQVVFHRLHGSS